KVDKKGIAPTYRWGIGERDEYSVGLYHLETDGRPLYSHPQLTVNGRIVALLDPQNYYGLASDSVRTDTTYGTLSHIRRLGQDSQIKTQFRQGHYERDLLGSATRFASGTSLENFASAVINRSPKGRRAESDITQLQSDYTGGFEAWGLKHSMIAGVDLYDEKALRNNSTVAGLVNPPTNAATPNDGAVASGTRAAIPMATFKAQALGLYAQDTLSLTQAFKIVAGLRLDHFKANYLNLSQQPFNMSESLWSPRLGALWQPDSDSTYYTSWGQSYNTQGDTYQWTPSAASGTLSGNNLKWLNTPPEKSRNFEVGAKFNVFDRKGLLGLALFRSEKFNERNLDEPTENNYL
ncbi:MAG: TonB-dependent siderophore receptor, partial [Betaproteobacteria bacterium]|nr:TonB-dependent siderophore receptor [Betaproteobacteria bacterium]